MKKGAIWLVNNPNGKFENMPCGMWLGDRFDLY